MQWREWSGYFAASVYADFHDIEYNAIREQAALIDVSPLYKYEVHGRDAEQLVEDAEQCFRCAKIPRLKKEVAEGLEAAGHQLMARAVEIETILEREKWKK